MVFGPSVYNVPLLPYEKELIKTIGITEEEYKEFTAEVRRRGRVRPAEYAHIPDIQNADPVVQAVLINLAISLVLTGVSYLLTPKPKMPSARRESGGAIDLAGATGANRFTPSRGFETLAELADYASPVPIIFGRYHSRKDIQTGGMLVTPRLIWSRMFSHETFQRAQLLFAVGEQGVGKAGIAVPDLEGIFLGNNALDQIYDDFFAFYWKKNSQNTNSPKDFRIRVGNHQYGTKGTPDSGDPGAIGGKTTEVFVCPDLEQDDATAFCQAYSPANSTEFGVYNPIANGTGYRVNYDIISIPGKANDPTPATRSQALSRLKIVGDENYFRPVSQEGQGEAGHIGDDDHIHSVINDNQRGIGRNYSPRMGITEIIKNGSARTSGGNLVKTISDVSVNDVAKFVISASSIKSDQYQYEGRGESVDDINSDVESLQIAADDAMRLGELFEIGGCIWRVTARKLTRFSSTEDQVINLTCIDSSHSFKQSVGVVHPTRVIKPTDEYIGDSVEGKEEQNVEEDFYPINKVSIAVVRNNRPAVVTEIGIKSTVFQALRGICSFNSLITPDEIEEFGEDNIQINTGRASGYIVRTTIFRVFVRKVGDSNAAYDVIPLFFAIRGSRPTAQYTFIRFKNNDLGAEELEFKFMQMSASELREVPGNQTVYDISEPNSGNTGGLTKKTVTVGSLGEMEIAFPCNTFQGFKKRSIEQNKEFFRKPRTIAGTTTGFYPETVVIEENRPENISANLATGDLKRVVNIGSIDNSVQGKSGAFLYDLAGDSDSSQYTINQDYTFETQEYISNRNKPTEANEGYKRSLYLRWTLKKVANGTTYAVNNGQQTTWRFRKVEVLGCIADGSIADFNTNDEYEIKRGAQATNILSGHANYPDSNPFVNNHPDGDLRWSGMKFKAQEIRFEEAVDGKAQSYRYEIFGDARDYALDTTRRVEQVITDTTGGVTKDVKIRFTATTKRLASDYALQNRIGWSTPKLKVIIDGTTTTNWPEGETTIQTYSVGSDNPHRTVYDRAGFKLRVASLQEVSVAEPETTQGDALFAERTQISDISYYRSLVEKSNDSSPEHEIVYVNEIQENDSPPTMESITLAGLSLKAGRSFTQLDQLRCWLAEGIPVERLHPDREKVYEDTSSIGPSNLFTDLVYFLLTDQMAGAGGLMGMDGDNAPLVDKEQLIETSKFLFKEKLFFNGSIVDRSNLRQFIADMAPYFLCNFVITDGKFSIKPALPVGGLGGMKEGAVPIEQLFTEGNILEDSYKIDYLSSEERRSFRAVVRYRQEQPNTLPEEKAISVEPTSGGYVNPGVELLPQEQFDLTQFCTSESHAVLVAKYFLSLRKLITHTISFSTTVDGLSIKAGSFIKVVTQSSPYSSASVGTVNGSGVITSVTDLLDGQYIVNYYSGDASEVEQGVMPVSNGVVTDSTFYNTVFSVVNDVISQNVYVVEQLTFSQEGTVDIVASEHPCFDDGSSKLVDAIKNDSFLVT